MERPIRRAVVILAAVIVHACHSLSLSFTQKSFALPPMKSSSSSSFSQASRQRNLPLLFPCTQSRPLFLRAFPWMQRNREMVFSLHRQGLLPFPLLLRRPLNLQLRHLPRIRQPGTSSYSARLRPLIVFKLSSLLLSTRIPAPLFSIPHRCRALPSSSHPSARDVSLSSSRLRRALPRLLAVRLLAASQRLPSPLHAVSTPTLLLPLVQPAAVKFIVCNPLLLLRMLKLPR